MPFYTVSLAQDIRLEQRNALAEAITFTHCSLFNVPSLFINIAFEDASARPYYVGGKLVYQMAYLRRTIC